MKRCWCIGSLPISVCRSPNVLSSERWRCSELSPADSHHRAVGISDLLIAACADVNRAVLLHYDHDFDLVAEITGQSAVWVVPRGAVP